MAASVSAAPARMNGAMSPTAAEDEDLYTQLLHLQAVVVAGKHPQFRLSPTAVEQLQTALITPEIISSNTAANATNNASSAATRVNGLPGLGAHTALDPIFLEKSDSLVKAESQLKRQRLERDLQTQQEQRRHVRVGRDADNESFSLLAVDEVLRAAQDRVKPVSGLKPAKAVSMSPFDENDYYSSQAPSPWSSAKSSKDSDKGAGAFTASFERHDGARPTLAESSTVAQKRQVPIHSSSKTHKAPQQTYMHDVEDIYDPDDEDEEYSPPDATAFDHATEGMNNGDIYQDNDEGEMSDYEPGEITGESAMLMSNHPSQAPIIRNNHLTHIAAPQPNRVSPLATAKGPSLPLELVNGCPVVAQPKPQPQPQQRSRPMRSRVSTASPSGPGSNTRRKQRGKKRKRDLELPNSEGSSIANRVKKRPRDRAVAHSPPFPAQREPYIKDEPISPPPFGYAPEAPPYHQLDHRAQPQPVNLTSPNGSTHQRHPHEQQQSGLRYEYVRPESPAIVSVASPGGYRPIQRDTQDLRRVASMHHAQRPASPAQRIYSPIAPYRAAAPTYVEPQPVQYAPQTERQDTARYVEPVAEPRVQYIRTDRASPPRIQEYQDPHARVQSPIVMAPPPLKRIVVDQYGNRYYAPDAAPVSARASVAPVDRQLEMQPAYERAPSRMSVAYAPPPPPQYEPVDTRMPPPPPPIRRQEQPVEYVDASGYSVREYSTRPVEAPRYAPAPTSPIYQEVPRYDAMPPPAPPGPPERTSPVYQTIPRYEAMPPPPAPITREQTSPVYQQAPRAYSVRPHEAPPSAMSYVRQASVAPVQYIQQSRREMPPPAMPPPHRAVSVAPGVEYRAQSQQQEYRAPVQQQEYRASVQPHEYRAPTQQPAYAYAPQTVRYVDQYGREVDPQHLRQGSVARY
ncbi:hypothetical protein LTR97_005421 [Elasticomyces elasticus]|uniref:Uncharacterized protein n=1 Tax=Elasticomyces elasticus TaxID=574655 RepID=A0AAN7WKU2_9PEZI|nr:hypothetical protein LTR97_005421 [Elasticomyces elasticus]